jgi:hypothetical protein
MLRAMLPGRNIGDDEGADWRERERTKPLESEKRAAPVTELGHGDFPDPIQEHFVRAHRLTSHPAGSSARMASIHLRCAVHGMIIANNSGADSAHGNGKAVLGQAQA